MDAAELAKLLLVEDVPEEYIWIYERSSNGYCIPCNDGAIYNYAANNGLAVRIIRGGTVTTCDLHFNRININLDLNNKITGVDYG